MSIDGNLFQFLKPTHRLLSSKDLQLPDQPSGKTPSIRMNVGEIYLVFTPDRKSVGRYRVTRWLPETDATPKMAVLEEVKFLAQLYLTDWQAAYLLGRGQLRVISAKDNDCRAITEGSALSLVEDEIEKSKRRAAYLDAVYKAAEKENGGETTRPLIKRVLREVAERRGENAPNINTYYRWAAQDRENGNFDRMLGLAEKVRVGNTTPRFAPRVEQLVEQAVHDVLSDPEGDWEAVTARIMQLCANEPEYQDLGWMFKDGKFQMSDRTVQRRLAGVDKYTQSLLRYGVEYAERKHASYARIARPELPLQVVDVDNSTLNVVVIDDEHPISFGRPNLAVFRDRHSNIVVGFDISFGPPSFDTFLAGLRHAMFPKPQEDLPVGVTYPWYGRPVRIGVDNAMEHLGRDIQNAAVQIGFQTVEYRPYRPWEKGAEEYLFAQTGHQLINRLPGSTTSSIEERKKYDREKGTEKEKAVPVLTLSELRGLLYRYFSDLHHRPAKGLGDTSMMKGVPNDLWEKGIVLAEPASPIDEEIFVRLSGNSADLTIQDYGTQWDHIVYVGVGQQQVKLHPKHKKGKRYRFVRDPHDLGHIWLHDPYSGEVLKIEATPRDIGYAKGLTRYQHKRIVEYHREKYKKIEGTASLRRSRQELENELIEYHAQRKKHQTALKLARFLGRQEKKIAYAHTIEVAPTPVGGGRITQAAPVDAEPKIKRSKRAGARDPKPVVVAEAQEGRRHVEPSPSKVHDDISEIRKRNEGWDD